VIDFRNLLLPLAACSTAEGYFFSCPCPAEQITKWLTESPFTMRCSRRLAPSGGFLCVMSGATINDAQPRFGVSQITLAADSGQSGRRERRLAIR
jgi:hypothetical protein